MRSPRNLALAAATATLVLATAAPAPAAPARGATATLRLLNEARTAHGIAPLKADTRLARAARGHSRDMVARRYFSHVAPGGAGLRARVARTGWMHGRTRWAIGENLAWGSGSLGSPAAIVKAWMDSPSHRHNVLDRRFHVVGIGVVSSSPFGADGATFTADFGS
jgi:uncharacterized protein YkwD